MTATACILCKNFNFRYNLPKFFASKFEPITGYSKKNNPHYTVTTIVNAGAPGQDPEKLNSVEMDLSSYASKIGKESVKKQLYVPEKCVVTC